MSANDLHSLLDPKVSDSVLTGFFPGCGFYGPLVGRADSADMRCALGVLALTLELHAMLCGCDALIELDPDNWYLPTLHRVREVEKIANEHLGEIRAVISEHALFSIELGSGYDEKLNNEDSIPQCHILHTEVALQPVYRKWLEQRVAVYNAVAGAMRSSKSFYLHMHNQTRIVDTDGLPRLEIDVYGTQTLDEGWDRWLDEYDATVEEDAYVSALEIVAGLRHLADILATLHLSTAIPIVDKGMFGRFGSEDSLTDLWLKCYDCASDADYIIGSCEVCGRLYIGSHKRKRGHEACMNKQRVMRSRSKKFASLITSGTSLPAASKKAGISAAKAVKILKDDGGGLDGLIGTEGGASSLVLRKARLEDAPAVFRMVHKTIHDVYPSSYEPAIVDSFCDLHGLHVIESDIKLGKITIIECCSDILATGTLDSNHIARVFVDSDYLGIGLGSFIMDSLEEEAASKECRLVCLNTSIPGKRFYEARGYKVASIENWEAPNGAILEYETMEKALSNL
ncbi:MAG: GNAT family N-acetyltransferase [Eggerthellales bacterium]|nr:GNAT family N-acetyltransferase [Eggerthellales bacterium]